MKENLHGNIRVTAPTINELTLPRQLSVETSYTKFHENPTNRIGADIRSRTDGLALRTRRFFFFTENAQKAVSLFGLGEKKTLFFFGNPVEHKNM